MDENGLPTEYALLQNYPNPFNPSSKVSYTLPEGAQVSIKVYNIMGMEVQRLVDEYQNAGIYTVLFDAKDLATGIIVYRMTSGDYVETKKMVLMK